VGDPLIVPAWMMNTMPRLISWTRPSESNNAELPDNCWGAEWDGKDWLCFNSFEF
jgi:hypothetical protein